MSGPLFALERNVVVLASAGTGKTHGLVGAYLHLVLGASRLGGARPRSPIAPERIVATTFSRRAAAELRARLSTELDALASAPAASRYAADLRAAAEACGVAFDPKTIAARAATARAKLHAARVTTLHAFAYELVRAHSLEIGLPPGLGLMNEEEERELRERAVDLALGAFARAEPAAAAELSAIAGTGERLEDTLLAAVVELEEAGGAVALRAALGDDVELERLNRELLRHAEALTGESVWAEPARAVLATRGEDPAALGELFARRAPRSASPAVEAFIAFRRDALHGTRKNSDRGAALARAFTLRARFGANAEAAVRLLQGVERAAQRLCERSAKLGFGGVLRLARDLVRERPDVAAALGAEIDALLVDEFQDTSRVQCELVSLLWDADPKGRASGALPALGAFRPAGLCVVGDRKQSIYAFRGADVGVFSRFCVALAGEPARDALGLPREVVDVPAAPTADLALLRANYRSAPELLAFANAFSEALLHPASPSVYEARYVESTEQLLPRPGAIADPLAPRVTWVRPEGAKKSTPAEDARIVAARIAAIMRAEQPRRAFRDVAVLAQTNDMLDAVAQELARLAIPHVVAGRGFFRAREVRDLVALLTTVVRPLDRRALLEVARGPWAGASDRALLGLSEPGAGVAPVDEWGQGTRRHLIPPDELEPLRAVADVILRLRRAVDRIGPAGVLREAVRALDLEATLVMLPRGVQRVANVRKLVALAEREPRARALLDRIERAERGREQEAATFSDEDDAVRLLTVHASKGLDFPVVVIPQVAVDGASRGGSPVVIDRAPDGGPLLAAKLAQPSGRALEPPSHRRAALAKRARERADHRRLAYVAVTRARDEMIFVGTSGASRAPDDASVAFALDRVCASRAWAWTVRVEPPAPQPPLPATLATTAELPAWAGERAPRVVRQLPIATTALADFHHCPRRFQLAHVLELPERGMAGGANLAGARGGELDARAEGVLTHRVLEIVPVAAFGSDMAEAEVDARLDKEGVPDGVSRARVRERALGFLRGAYAKRVARAGAEVIREAPFVLVEDAGGVELVLKGSIDLLVRWPDGRVDVIDYKRARGPALEPHAFQLDAYTLAARAGDPAGAPEAVRAGIVFLGGNAGEPRFRERAPDDAIRASLADVVRRLCDARAREAFPRIARPGCRALKCGYEPMCHPEREGTQLGLFG